VPPLSSGRTGSDAGEDGVQTARGRPCVRLLPRPGAPGRRIPFRGTARPVRFGSVPLLLRCGSGLAACRLGAATGTGGSGLVRAEHCTVAMSVVTRHLIGLFCPRCVSIHAQARFRVPRHTATTTMACAARSRVVCERKPTRLPAGRHGLLWSIRQVWEVRVFTI
jgi:hypothetical protein